MTKDEVFHTVYMYMFMYFGVRHLWDAMCKSTHFKFNTRWGAGSPQAEGGLGSGLPKGKDKPSRTPRIGCVALAS